MSYRDMQPVKTSENSFFFFCFFKQKRNIHKYISSLFLKVLKLKPYLAGLIVYYGKQTK